jgi:hypothetical protein
MRLGLRTMRQSLTTSDEFFNEESDATDVCEAVQHLIPSNMIASEAMDLPAQRERWAPLDEESEAFRISVKSLWDAVQRGV